MSSLASLFNSSATLFTIDFYQKYKPKAPEAELVRVGRIATVVVVILGILWIPVMKGIGKVLYAYLQDVQSLLAPGIAGAFLLGILSKKVTPAAGLTGLLTGFTIGMARLIATVFKGFLDTDGSIYQVFVGTNWLHYEIINFAIVIVTMIIVSSFTPRIDERKIAGLYLGSASVEQKAITRASWNKWDVIASGFIIAVILAFYAYFWN
jgi:SSS family solute:Na+ symporter